ncbi:MAG: DUF3795 domain-containing protein [Saprospiraceae bacterium]|nr:DUF3795 domain-containing protein [Saprospiraceae bacterium]
MLSEQELIAPCGMNCGLCMAYLREKNRCEGCRGSNENKPNQCVRCIILNCEFLAKTKSGFCYECEKIPCRRLKQLDKRYRTKYNMSMLENLESIKTIGLEQFVKNEKERWKCEVCGGTICVHYGLCLTCNDRKKVKRK